MESTAPGTRRPLGVVAASLGAVVVALVLISIGVVSTTAGHGAFSGAVGIFLVLYGLFIIVAGWALWRGSLLARGPVLATGVLNLIVAVSLAGSAIQSWLLAGVAGTGVSVGGTGVSVGGTGVSVLVGGTQQIGPIQPEPGNSGGGLGNGV